MVEPELARGQPENLPLTVARATEDEWQILRALRLAALAESPDAFSSNLQVEQSFEPDRWRAWTQSAAVFVATVDDTAIGMAAVTEQDGGPERSVHAVWVDPRWRRRGAGQRLMETVEDWARSEGADRIALWGPRVTGPRVGRTSVAVIRRPAGGSRSRAIRSCTNRSWCSVSTDPPG